MLKLQNMLKPKFNLPEMLAVVIATATIGVHAADDFHGENLKTLQARFLQANKLFTQFFGPELIPIYIPESIDFFERAHWVAVQEFLNRNGYDAGPEDGIPGTRTEEAVVAYQWYNDLPSRGLRGAPEIYRRAIEEAPNFIPAGERAFRP